RPDSLSRRRRSSPWIRRARRCGCPLTCSRPCAMPRCLLPSRSLAVLLLVGAWAACASAPAPEPPPPPPPAPAPRLADADIDAIADLRRLEDRREYDEAVLRAGFEHPNPEVRRRAALAIGRIGDRRGTPLLLQALTDTSALVRADAAFALGESGDSS